TITFQRVGGGTITVNPPTAVANTNNTVFNVTFAAQSTAGNYRVDIAPTVADTNGNLLNQNGNATNGETTADKYTEFFTLQPQFIFSNTTSTPLPAGNIVSQTVTLPALGAGNSL